MSLLKSKHPSAAAITAYRFDDLIVSERVDADISAPTESGDGAAILRSADGNEASGKLDARVIETDRLLQRISELEDAASDAAAGLEDIRNEAFDAGKLEGIESAQKGHDEWMELLRSGIAKAQSDFAANLKMQLDIGIQTAGAAIEQVLGDEAQLSDHVIKTAERWIQELSSARIVRLRVAEADFSDAEALVKLNELVGPDNLIRDPSLEKGACIFDLRMGKLDASIPLQLRNAQEHLGRMQSDQNGDVPC